MVLLAGGCGSGGGEEEDPPSTEGTTSSTDAAITAPPTMTPEEQAEAEIRDTFEGIIAARDQFNAAADQYTRDDVLNGDVTSDWAVTSGGELELMSQAESWLSAEFNAVGETVIARHDIVGIQLQGTDDVDDARSTACLDISGFTFTTYDGTPAEPGFEPDEHQTWIMEWLYFPNAAPSDGLDEAGWYLSELKIERGGQC